MKTTIIVALLSLATNSAFADLTNCSNLFASYACSYQGTDFDMTFSKVDDVTVSMAMMGDSAEYVIDGQEHKAKAGSDILTGTCTKEAGIVIISKYNNAAQQISYTTTSTGLNYKIEKPNQEPMTIPCIRQ